MIRGLLLLAAMCLALQGCIPVMIGGYVGYKMAEHDAHAEWCGQHIGDESCHP